MASGDYKTQDDKNLFFKSFSAGLVESGECLMVQIALPLASS